MSSPEATEVEILVRCAAIHVVIQNNRHNLFAECPVTALAPILPTQLWRMRLK